MLRSLLFIGASLALSAWSPAPVAQPATPADGWARSTKDHDRTLSYSADVTVLGQPSHLDARFYCSTVRTKMETGAIGFDLDIARPDTITSFHFDEFEGPDAPAGKRQLLTATIVRPDGTKQPFRGSPSGSYSPRESFMFEISDVFYRKGTTARRVLEELRADAASLAITIVDYRVASTRIALTIPMNGRSDDFRWLLADLP
jgi:hypothetical protein